MKRLLSTIAFTFFMVIICSACQSNNNKVLNAEVREIKVSNAVGMYKEPDETLGIIRDQERISSFYETLRNPSVIKGENTLDNPDYTFIVIHDDDSKEMYHFWDSWTTGRIARVHGDKATIFEISKEQKEDLIHLIPEKS